ncbi:hypothetical protein B0H19DRAFT_1260104 [Mycena capillaripes]|nr:hypothetical protein B0H19DRAFT_1260104 [Mycena capillaripes]
MNAPNLEAEYLIGPWLIGTCIELVFQGIISTQFVKYFTRYRDDPLALKVFVGGLVLLTYALSIQMFTILWTLFAVHFGTLQGVVPHASVGWLTASSGVVRATVGLYVQGYFCSRLFLLSKKSYIVVAMAIIFVVAFVANVVAAYFYIFQGADGIFQVEKCYNIYLPLTMVGDLILTFSTAYFLIKCKKNVLPQSVGILNALIRLTFQTAVPATICAFINFIFSLTFPNVYPGARATASTASNIVLPKLYALSMMWTLNARRRIRAALNDSHVSTFNTNNTGERTVGNAELGTAKSRLKMSTDSCAPQKEKSHLGTGAENQARIERDGRAGSCVVDTEGSDEEELIFARGGSARLARNHID